MNRDRTISFTIDLVKEENQERIKMTEHMTKIRPGLLLLQIFFIYSTSLYILSVIKP